MPRIPLSNIITAVSDLTRWKILRELVKGEPLPVKEIARRISAKPDSVARHCIVLHDFGIVLRGFGRLYRIAPPFLVPGEVAVDLGAVVIRLDRLD